MHTSHVFFLSQSIGYVILASVSSTTILVLHLWVKTLQCIWRSGAIDFICGHLIFKWVQSTCQELCTLCFVVFWWLISINRECDPGGHYWHCYPGALSLIQATATHLKIGHPKRVPGTHGGCPIFKWVAETCLQGRVPWLWPRQWLVGDRPYCPHVLQVYSIWISW